jgi:NAD-dependent DNA ligase
MNIDELAQRLKEASDQYYNQGNSDLSDEAYDLLVDELKALDPQNPFLQTVGSRCQDF